MSDAETARRWIDRLAPHVGVFKVGLELFVSAGPRVLEHIRSVGARSFLDLKLHDIPETVGRAVAVACAHEVDLLTVHALGGSAMLRAAVTSARGAAHPPTVLAVTVLTSMDDATVTEIGLAGTARSAALALGELAVGAGVGGLVCSALEVAALRSRHPDAVLVTPGIRPADGDRGDQARVATPSAAIRAGATLLVVGRPIRDAAEPEQAAERIVAEIDEALA